MRTCADLVHDNMLLAKLTGGDTIATEAKYHPRCLLNLYYKAGRAAKSSEYKDDMDENLSQCSTLVRTLL